MVIHKATEIEDSTRMEIVLSECSYNMACDYLNREMPKGTFIGCKSNRNGDVIIKFKNREFLYIESKGILLGN